MRAYVILLTLSIGLAQEEARTLPRMASTQRLEGRVIDRKTGDPLPSAIVQLGGKGVYTDAQGRFSLPFIQSGDTLTVAFPEYRTKKILIGRPGTVVIGLEPYETTVEPVEIVSEVSRETEAAVALERLRSLEFGESYTSDQIMKRTTDFYVPNVLRRMPGVSILGGRWISLRGLSERYNAMAFWAAYPTWLRYDASMPAVNELVSTLLGRIEVRKVWTPELLGHFGGGMIDFQLPEGSESGLTIALTGEIGTWGLWKRYPLVRGSWEKWENRDLPDPFTIQQSAPADRPSAQNFEYARLYQRLVLPDTGAFAPPGSLVTISYATTKGRLQGTFRVVYGQRYSREQIEFGNGQFGYDSAEGQWYYNQTLYGKANELWRLSQNIGFAGSLSFHPSESHTLTLSLLGLDMRTQQHALEVGRWLYESIQDSQVYSWYWYPTYILEQSRIGIGRLRWLHRKEKIHTQVETGFIGQQYIIPTMAAMNYAQYPSDTTWTYDFGIIGAYEPLGLSWHSRTVGLQGYAHPSLEWLPIQGRWWLRLKVGAWYSWEGYRSTSRTLGLMPDTTQSPIFPAGATLLTQIKDIYNPNHLVPGGFWLVDRTEPFNSWNGTTQIIAGYTLLRMGIKRWEGLAGIRYEAYDRNLRHAPFGTLPERQFLSEKTADLLPCFITKYQTGPQSHLRIAAYRTLIRPPLTSQIPVKFFGYVYAHFWSGDTLYRTGSAWNIDWRWEYVRNPYEIIAISLFYKSLKDLPEMYLEPSSITTVLVYKTRNRSYGEIGGIELEFRQIIWGDEISPKLWGYLNATLSESGSRFWRAFRDPYNERLQGQSPYVLNVGLLSRPQEKWEVGSFFNYTGPQIWIIGFDKTVYPHVVEGARAYWEVQVSRQMGRWEARLSVWDILNQPYRRLQRAGNLAEASSDQIAIRSAQREEWRFFLTLRYRIF